MKINRTLKRIGLVALMLSTLAPQLSTLFAQGTAFTYQGRLTDGSTAAGGIYDLRFTIFDSTNVPGTAVAGPLTNSAVAVSNGLFTVALDFGGAVFTGSPRWLEISVRTNGSGAAHTALRPRQPLTPSPYAIRAGQAGTANTVAPGGVVNTSILVASVSLDKLAPGVLHPSNFPPNSVTSTQLADVIALGSSNVVGQLDIFGTDAAPAITLSGDTSRISTFGSDGRERTRLWGPGTSWGELQLLNNLSNNALAAWLTANGSLGGALVLRDTNALNRAFLRGGNAGGTLQLFGDGGDRIQLDSSSNSWFSAGNVGFGHIAPTHPLDVEGVSRYRVNPFNHLLLSGFFDDAQIDFVKNSTNPVPSGRIEFNGYTHPDAHGASIRFYTREFADTNVLLRMVIAENGRVGLGTDTPQALLDVAGTVRANAFESAGTALMLSTTDNQPLEFKVNGARALRLEPSVVSPNVIGGFSGNAASAGVDGAAIGGGGDATRPNTVTGDFGTVSGGAGNSATGSATVGGGVENVAGAFGSAIAGGNWSRIETPAFNAAIGGGQSNVIRAGALQAAIAGGFNNLIGSNASSASIGGGFNNVVGTNAFYAVVAGGGANRIGQGSFGTFIGGGQSNVIGTSAALAMIPGGEANAVNGFTSLAAGTRAQALHSGAFVWADRSAPATPFASTGNDQFLIRANGGVGVNTANPGGAMNIVGPLKPPPAGMPASDNGLILGVQALAGYKWIQSYGGSLVLNPVGNNVGIGKTNPATALDVNGTVTATTFNPPSDRQLKENFQRVNPRDVLEKVAGLDITRWNFKGDAATVHLGPVAQDFHAAFGLGTDDKHIATVDADGVALAAIQGLNEKVEVRSERAEGRTRELEQRLEQKETEITELKHRLETLEQIIHQKTK